MRKIIGILCMAVLLISGCSFSCQMGDDEQEQKGDLERHELERYEEAGYGFTGDVGFAVKHPVEWIYEKPDENIVIFSGKEGTEAYDATVNIQTIRWGEAYNRFEDLYDDYKHQIEGVGGEITEMGNEEFYQDGETYNSIAFFVEYEDEVLFNQFVVAIDRKDGYLHQLCYTAPQQIYEKYEDEAVSIMNSLELLMGDEDIDDVDDVDNEIEVSKKGQAEIELNILNEELRINQGFENVYLDLEVKNIGEIPIKYEDTVAWNPDYTFIGMLNDEAIMMYQDSMEIEEEQFIPVGQSDGVRIFDKIEPGEIEVLRYGLGGRVHHTSGGISAAKNRVVEKLEDEGIYEAQFKVDFGIIIPEAREWTQTFTIENYEESFDIVQSSNTIDVYVETFEGNMGEEDMPCPMDYDLVEKMKDKLLE